jgi:short chain dehydrogenase
VIGIARTGDATFPGELRTADLSDRDATSSALQDISSTYRIDAVVNNVGLVRPQMLEQVTLDALDAVLDVNLRPAIQLTQAALPGMRQQGWGRVVNIASLVALGAAAHRVRRGQGGADQLYPRVGVGVGPASAAPRRSPSCCPTTRLSSPVRPCSSMAARRSDGRWFDHVPPGATPAPRWRYRETTINPEPVKPPPARSPKRPPGSGRRHTSVRGGVLENNCHALTGADAHPDGAVARLALA